MADEDTSGFTDMEIATEGNYCHSEAADAARAARMCDDRICRPIFLRCVADICLACLRAAAGVFRLLEEQRRRLEMAIEVADGFTNSSTTSAPKVAVRD